jgi:fimbrial chaperone protein
MTFLRRKGSRRKAATLTLALALAAPAPAAAGTFAINPVNVLLPLDRSAAELRLTNADSNPVTVRVSAYRWTQKDGRDSYEPTRDVVVSPPIFAVAAGATQLIRIGTRTRIPGAAYRIVVEEVPGPATGAGINVALRLDLPLYVLSEAHAQAELSWTAQRDAHGRLLVTGHNAGGRHAQILGIVAQDASGRRIAATGAMGVVLPASERSWNLGESDSIPAQLLIRTANGETRTGVRVDPR